MNLQIAMYLPDIEQVCRKQKNYCAVHNRLER